MQDPPVREYTFPNGLTLLGQPMPWLESAAFSIYLPAGCQYDPIGRQGLANFACELTQRGCGELDSKAFVEALEALGVDSSSSVSTYHTRMGGAMKKGELLEALKIYSDVIRHPWLPETQMEESRLVCVQEIRALEDDLAQLVMNELRQRHYGDPLGRSSEGMEEAVAAIDHSDVVEFVRTRYQPRGAILAVAGNFDFDTVQGLVAERLGSWEPVVADDPVQQPARHGMHHLPFESQQTHIGVAFPGLSYSDPNYYPYRAAIGVLSDGMSSRLFQEVREKRGLCYTVFATCHAVRDRGAVICYSGTSADRAQQTLDVLVAELRRLGEGVSEEELDRLKVQIRSGLIMQQESCRARSSVIAADWFHLGRVRTLDEINGLIRGLTAAAVNGYLADHPPTDFDVVTLGPSPLEWNDGIPATSA